MKWYEGHACWTAFLILTRICQIFYGSGFLTAEASFDNTSVSGIRWPRNKTHESHRNLVDSVTSVIANVALWKSLQCQGFVESQSVRTCFAAWSTFLIANRPVLLCQACWFYCLNGTLLYCVDVYLSWVLYSKFEVCTQLPAGFLLVVNHNWVASLWAIWSGSVSYGSKRFDTALMDQLDRIYEGVSPSLIFKLILPAGHCTSLWRLCSTSRQSRSMSSLFRWRPWLISTE